MMWKKIKYYLQLWDGFWSVPLMFGMFWLTGLLLQTWFGYETGVYDLAFIQPLFLSICIVIGATNGAVAGMYFTFRGLYRYLYGEMKDGRRRNFSKENWTHLKEWQRFIIAFSVFFYYVTAIIMVYRMLV